MPDGRGRPGWPKEKAYMLYQGVGIYGIEWFRRKTGKSLDAIQAKARRMYGHGGLSRGAFTVREASRRTGYHREQLYRAMQALRQKWKRTSSQGSYLIYEEQLEELVQWLKTDYWSGYHRLYGCLWCDTQDRPHYELGLCQRCYQRFAQRLCRRDLPLARQSLLELVRAHPSILGEAVTAEVETQLDRGRVPAEFLLVKFVRNWSCVRG